MKNIPTRVLALVIAVVVELTLLILGDFRLGWGPTGPDSAFLFLTHFLAMMVFAPFAYVISILGIEMYFLALVEFISNLGIDLSRLQEKGFEILLAIINTLLIWGFLAILIRWRRKRRAAREAGTE